MPHQSNPQLTRRGVISCAAAAALMLPGFASAAESDPQPLAKVSGFPQMPTGGTGVTPCESFAPPPQIATFGRIASATEPGQPLEISGTVYREGRAAPAPGIVLFAYHTDASGAYNRPNSPFRPRLHGWAKTDAEGRYGFRTIKPAAYPDHSSPAHIHVNLFGDGIPEYWVDDYWFAGDPLITPKQLATLTGRGGGKETLDLTLGADGVLRGQRDFVLEHVPVSGGCRLLDR